MGDCLIQGDKVLADWSILCDFDGTISVDDVTDILLERFGKPGWQALEKRWLNGEISSRMCMQAQIAMLDASKEELDLAIDDIRIDPAFPAFLHATKRYGWPVTIVSDGLDYAIKRILAHNGITDIPVRANRLLQAGTRAWQLESPYANTACKVDSGMCKCACAKLEQKDKRLVLLIGDGASDFCAAGRADFVFAKYRLNEYCRQHDLHHISILGFADAIELLPALAGEMDDLKVAASQALELRVNA